MPFDDEMPEAPVVSGPASAKAIPDEFDAAIFDGVGKVGDAMPAGTFHFRLDYWTEEWAARKDRNGAPLVPEVLEPFFAIRWKCQEEPHVGRIVFDNIPWVRPEDIRDAAAGDPNAKSVLNDRLKRANSIMDAAGYKPTGKSSFKAFLASNPEIKIQVNQNEKKQKGPSGKWDVPTGEMRNGISKYLSLHRPS